MHRSQPGSMAGPGAARTAPGLAISLVLPEELQGFAAAEAVGVQEAVEHLCLGPDARKPFWIHIRIALAVWR